MRNYRLGLAVSAAVVTLFAQSSAFAACADVTRSQFVAAANQAALDTDQFGFGLPMWASMVDESGKVCHVYSTDSGFANIGAAAGNNAWLGSRVISAQKANTANAFSLDALAISTGAVSVAVLPGGSLYGLQHSNPVDASSAYKNAAGSAAADSATFGKGVDPLVGKNIGGVNVFGGGVALYNGSSVKIGGIGASGDTSCRDHAFAYRMRIALGMNNQPNDDGLVLVDTTTTGMTALFQQPACGVADPTAHTYDSSAADYGIR